MTSIRLAVTDEERAAYSTTPYFGVSILKLILMSVCSIGFYGAYWCYRQWKRERDRTGESLSPFWRAVFAPIWTFSLLERIHKRAMSSRVPAQWSPNAVALGYLVLNLVWRLPDPYWLVSLFAFVPLIPVQQTINTLNSQAAPDADRNTRFSGRNIALLVFGGLFVVLGTRGTLFPVE